MRSSRSTRTRRSAGRGLGRASRSRRLRPTARHSCSHASTACPKPPGSRWPPSPRRRSPRGLHPRRLRRSRPGARCRRGCPGPGDRRATAAVLASAACKRRLRSPDEDERRQLHGRLAGGTADPEERARHLALATTGPDAIVAVHSTRPPPMPVAEGRRKRLASSSSMRAGSRPRPIWRISSAASCRRPSPSSRPATRVAHERSSKAGRPHRARPERADALRLPGRCSLGRRLGGQLALLDEALERPERTRACVAGCSRRAPRHCTSCFRDGRREPRQRNGCRRRGTPPEAIPQSCAPRWRARFAKLNVGDALDRTMRDELMALSGQIEGLRVFQWPAFAHALTEVDTITSSRPIKPS